ncbi:MAG: segregation and condensation protein A [Phycisphaerae bacterium]|nr:MAG: segregation and condensation protein A [Phycisphaerae bacterium]
MPDYKVDLEAYNGPLDLLLFLIRRSEVDIYDIPITQITEQYIAYVRVLEDLDPNLAADFIVMAATLMEIKSRTLLPKPPVVEEEDEFIDPRMELVRQLLDYKRFKDAAATLDDARAERAEKHERVPVTPRINEEEVDLDEVQIWDLIAAFQKVLDATGVRNRQHEVLYDDTPIALHAADILDILGRNKDGHVFQKLFEGRTKSQLIGLFLAVLELIRKNRIRAVQKAEFDEIQIQLLDDEPITVDEESDYRSNPNDVLNAFHETADDHAPDDHAAEEAEAEAPEAKNDIEEPVE